MIYPILRSLRLLPLERLWRRILSLSTLLAAQLVNLLLDLPGSGLIVGSELRLVQEIGLLRLLNLESERQHALLVWLIYQIEGLWTLRDPALQLASDSGVLGPVVGLAVLLAGALSFNGQQMVLSHRVVLAVLLLVQVDLEAAQALGADTGHGRGDWELAFHAESAFLWRFCAHLAVGSCLHIALFCDSKDVSGKLRGTKLLKVAALVSIHEALRVWL